MLSTIIKILIIIAIISIFLYWININDPKNKEELEECDLENLDLDQLVILNRKPEYRKLIDKIIESKKFIFTDKQLAILKNPNQFYKVSENGDVKNISNMIYSNCINNLDSVIPPNVEMFDNLALEQISESDNLYDNIVKEFKQDIDNTIKPDCQNSCILSNPKYLRNYYQDLYGNKVKADLIDYFADYYTNINIDKPKECLPVETLIGKPNFIIPDQYNIQKYMTNAYNVDWSRVINPNTIL